MKQLIFSIALVFICSFSFAQKSSSIKMDAQGNYFAVKTDSVKVKPVDTGKTYTDSKGIVYPVFAGAKGGIFIIRVSVKTGKEYRQYL